MGAMQERLVLGDSLNFATAVNGYSAADGWTLHYRLVPRGAGTPIDISSSAEGAAHRVQVIAATTGAWTAGAYSWHSYVTKGAESYTVGTGSTELLPNPRTTTSGLDLRSSAEQALAAVQAILLGKATSGTYSYRIGERELRSYTMQELLQLESKLKVEVKRERRYTALAAGMPDPTRVQVRLGRA